MWFFDESRFGTHSKIGHGWFKTGSRTCIDIKLGFKNFYIYSAANPKTGDVFSLIMPNVNTQCMNIFLQELQKYIGENRRLVIIMDGAGWHKSKDLIIPKNIKVIIPNPIYKAIYFTLQILFICSGVIAFKNEQISYSRSCKVL